MTKKRGVNKWGHRIGSMGDKIDRVLFTTMHIKKVKDTLGKRREIAELAKTPLKAVNDHIWYLSNRDGLLKKTA